MLIWLHSLNITKFFSFIFITSKSKGKKIETMCHVQLSFGSGLEEVCAKCARISFSCVLQRCAWRLPSANRPLETPPLFEVECEAKAFSKLKNAFSHSFLSHTTYDVYLNIWYKKLNKKE